MLEQVIRPFETPNTINDRQSVVSTVIKASPELAVAVWGAPGDNPTPQKTSGGISATVKADHNYTEVGRKTTDVKIENPHDSGQFVITQRIDQITFQHPEAPKTEDNNSGMSNGVNSNTAYANPPDAPAVGGDNPLISAQTASFSTPTKVSDRYTLKNPAPPA